MGKTGAYTMLQTADQDFGVPITDPEGFETLVEEHGLEPIVEWEYEDEEAYPRIERKMLYGFIPPSVEDDFKFFIKNLHIDRNEDDFRAFWEEVAAVCEPFEFYHAGADNHFPDLGEFYYRTHVSMTMYHVVSDGATVTVDEYEFTPDER